MTQDTIVILSVLGVVGQVLIVLALIVGVLALVGRPRAARLDPQPALGLRAVGSLRRRGDRDRRQPLLLAGRAFHALRVLLVPAGADVSALDPHAPDRRARRQPGRAVPAPAADRRRRHVDLPHADRARGDLGAEGVHRRQRPEAAAPSGSPTRIRLHHDPDPRAHGLPTYHRILSPRVHWSGRKAEVPATLPAHAER